MKVALLGSDSAGKTAFVTRFVANSFGLSTYKSTSDVDSYGKHGVLGDATCRLDIVDLNEGGKVREQAIYTSDGFLLFYDILSRRSFEEIHPLYQEVCRIKGRQPAMILVGSKLDRAEENRKVSSEEGRALGKELGCQFLEASALDGRNVDEAFSLLVNNLRLPTGRSTYDTVDNDKKEVQTRHGLVAPNSASGSVARVFGLLTRNLWLCFGRRK